MILPTCLGRLLFAFALLHATWAVPLALSAQDAADRAALERLRDSLAGVTDSTALRRLEAATVEVAKRHRDNPLIHLRLGFIAYRSGELAGSKAHYDDAAGEFEWAGELKPDWPYAWYGLGLAELAQGEHAIIAIENLRQQLGKDYLSKAARAFARATQADPSFAQAGIDLANAALQQRIQPQLQVALEAVRLAAASPAGRIPDVQLARGRVEREVGEADSAIAAFRAYLAVGGDSGVGLLELARTDYFARRPQEGRAAYDAGALPHGPGGVRRSGRHLHPPRRSGPPRAVPQPGHGPDQPRAERELAVPPHRRQPDLPLRVARRCAGLQARRERARRAGVPGALRAGGPRGGAGRSGARAVGFARHARSHLSAAAERDAAHRRARARRPRHPGGDDHRQLPPTFRRAA